MRIVDLQDEPRTHDGSVFFPHGVGDRVKKVFRRRVMLVLLVARDVDRRDRGNERFFRPVSVDGRPQVRNVPRKLRLTLVRNRSRADRLLRPQRRTARPRSLVELWKRQRLARAGPWHAPPLRPDFVTGQPFVGVNGKSPFREFAIVDDIYPHRDLASDDLVDRRPQLGVANLAIDGDAPILRDHRFDQPFRSRQTANMGGQNSPVAALHRRSPSQHAYRRTRRRATGRHGAKKCDGADALSRPRATRARRRRGCPRQPSRFPIARKRFDGSRPPSTSAALRARRARVFGRRGVSRDRRLPASVLRRACAWRAQTDSLPAWLSVFARTLPRRRRSGPECAPGSARHCPTISAAGPQDRRSNARCGGNGSSAPRDCSLRIGLGATAARTRR